MLAFKFLHCNILYYFIFIVFGWYIHFVEWTDILTCFIWKYVNPVEISYDYIVVGAGTAGSVVALRLAENSNHSVLVLEAGPRGGCLMDIPAAAIMLHLSVVDWQYKTVPQKHACKGLNNNISFWPMGKIVGGTSRLNALIYARGHPNDFRDWYKDSDHFDYNMDILQYFKKSEDYHGEFVDNDKYHSRRGPYRVEKMKYSTELQKLFLQSVQDIGYQVRDLNGEHNAGFMSVEMNLKEGKRWTTGHQLQGSKKTNIRLISNAQAEKILLHSNFEAYAIKYSFMGESYIVKAKKGIVLCAGVIGTPKLLMLSGIGPKDHLQEVGIPPKIDLPVGENLQDHVATGYDLIVFNRSLNFNIIDMYSPISIYNYFIKSQGALTLGAAEAIGILNTEGGESVNSSKPDLQVMILPLGISFDGGTQILESSNIRHEIFKSYFQPLTQKSAASFIPVVLHPRSRGTVRLLDKNPKSKPLIDPNYLSDPYDVEVLLKGIDLVKKIVKSEPMRRFGTQIYNKKLPGCENFEFDTKDYWTCYVKHLTLSAFHPVGTCKMGSTSDSVVNFDFQVYKTNKLYVVDGSVFPSLVSANPNAAIVMLAEKLADTIKFHEYLSQSVCTKYDIFIPNFKCNMV